MTKKVKTYMLLVAVILVWGMIAYKIFNAINPEAPKANIQEFSTTFNPKQIKEVDTFSIARVERDPFLGTLEHKSTQKPSQVKQQEIISWPTVVYGGIIKQQNNKTQVFIVTVNNNQYLLRKGQEIDGVTLIKGDNKTITIKYQKKLKTITK